MSETQTIQVQPPPGGPVTNMMLVSDINRQFPQCQPVFEKYGIAGCGGAYGPPEPLFIFAAAHKVPLPKLVDELNAAVRGEWKDDSRCTKGKRPEKESPDAETLYKRFVAGALLVALTFGMTLGVINILRIWMGESFYAISGAIKQAHGHAQIFGWVGLMIMGVSLHAVPRFKMVPLRPLGAAKAAFGMMLGGVLLRAAAQPFAIHPVFSAVMVLSAVLETAAVATFLFLITRVLWPSQGPREFYEKFIWASAAWFGVLAVWNLVATVQMALQHANAIGGLQDALLVHVALFGFISNMIFSFSMRVLPHFLGLRDPKVWAANAAFFLWNGAIFLRWPHDVLAWVASGMELAGAALFVYALGIFAKRRVKIEIQGVDNAFARFIVLGYAWLLVAAALPLHADLFRLTASSRHAMTIGFITAMILGVSHRVLPIFGGVNLHSSRAMRTTFWHFAAGSTLVVAMAFAAVYEAPWAFAWAGVGGTLVLSAVIIAAWNLGMTLLASAETFTPKSLVRPNTRVAEILEVRPELRPVLVHGGLSGLASMTHNPPRFVTVEFAARRHGIDPGPLIEALNNEIKRRQAT
ncbi:MAG: hypothetical protein HZA91_13485 [Verrucomicrobia bacterium]|nr:hypothetical protein [Verrucomicrobiota bacterium]